MLLPSLPALGVSCPEATPFGFNNGQHCCYFFDRKSDGKSLLLTDPLSECRQGIPGEDLVPCSVQDRLCIDHHKTIGSKCVRSWPTWLKIGIIGWNVSTRISCMQYYVVSRVGITLWLFMTSCRLADPMPGGVPTCNWVPWQGMLQARDNR